MRGKLHDLARATGDGGLIPAHAGKTHAGRGHGRPGRAHPRACGENLGSAWLNVVPSGSSPRMRGKPPQSDARRAERRLIPAHAGKTPVSPGIKPSHRAHPRACGENSPCSQAVITFTGSSPRMRGKLCYNRADRAENGLIPAHAGKTSILTRPKRGGRAHPRACGENQLCGFRVDLRLGSSPRMRGKRTLTRVG